MIKKIIANIVIFSFIIFLCIFFALFTQLENSCRMDPGFRYRTFDQKTLDTCVRGSMSYALFLFSGCLFMINKVYIRFVIEVYSIKNYNQEKVEIFLSFLCLFSILLILVAFLSSR